MEASKDTPTRGSISSKASLLDKVLTRGSLGKKRPYNYELEEAVLGAMMLEKDALSEVIEMLNLQSFDKEAHQKIFRAIVQLFENGEPVDIMTVSNRLRANGELELIGGAYYVSQLTARVNSAANILYHARILLQYTIKREIIEAANEILKQAYEETTDVFVLLDKFEQKLFEISAFNIRKSYTESESLGKELMQELETMKDTKDGLIGVPSGFTDLDRFTAGWQRANLVIIAARPGMGKTAFILSAMRNAAVDFKKAVVIFSLEMSAIELMKRLYSAESEIESGKFRTPNKMSEQEWKRLVARTAVVTQAPIFVDDTPSISILELRAKSRRLKAQRNIELIIVDYLQLMSGEHSGKSGNREQEIAHISRCLKQLAKELDIPVLALSQLSRAVEVRGGDKRPQLSDLRESGSIEQDADIVMFLYRPEYYDITEDQDGNPVDGLTEIMIAKQRNGSLGTAKIKFIPQYTKFADWHERDYMDDQGAYESYTMQSSVNSDLSGNKDQNKPSPF